MQKCNVKILKNQHVYIFVGKNITAKIDLILALKFSHKILYLIAQIQLLVQVIKSDICDWSAYVSYIIQSIRLQINSNPQITISE